MLRYLSGLIAVFFLSSLAAQPPNSQLYVFDLKLGDTLVQLSNPRYLSAFNPRGYNNHPSWDGSDLLYASVKLPDMAEPDVYRFDLKDNVRTRLTQTESGEYSPKKMLRGSRFSAVRQEITATDTILRLWEFPTELTDNGQPVFSSTNGIGYYEWLNNTQLALFMVGSPNTLVLASSNGDRPLTLATNTGRTFRRLNTGALVYVDKSTTPWQLVEKSLYRLDEQPRVLAPMPAGTEDFVILPDGSYLAGKGSRLYRLATGPAAGWQPVVDLSGYGIQDITRLAVNEQGRLALVARN